MPCVQALRWLWCKGHQMYYAVDGGDAQQMMQALQEQVQQTEGKGHWYALVDFAFDHEEGRKLAGWPAPTWPLYHASPLHTMAHVSPCLLALPPHPGSDDWARKVGQLIRHAGGRPMLSFVHSRIEVSALQSAWQSCLFVYTSDKLRMLLRFADTRVSCGLPQALSQTHWTRLCQPLFQWLIVDRHGVLRPLPMAALPDAPAHTDEPIELSDIEYAKLVAQGQADALVNALYEGIPEWLPQKNKAQLHGQMTQVVALVESFKIDKAPDQLALATATCVSHGALLTVPELTKVLANPALWPNRSLYDALLPLLPGEETAR